MHVRLGDAYYGVAGSKRRFPRPRTSRRSPSVTNDREKTLLAGTGEPRHHHPKRDKITRSLATMKWFNNALNCSKDQSQKTSEVDPLGAQASSRKIRGRIRNSRRARLNGDKGISPIPVPHSITGLIPFSHTDTPATGIAACGQSKAPWRAIAMTTPDPGRSTDRLSNPVLRLAEPSGARSTPASEHRPAARVGRMAADRTPCRRGWRTRRPERLPSRVGFRPRVGFLEQRTLLSALPTLTALIASTAAAGRASRSPSPRRSAT